MKQDRYFSQMVSRDSTKEGFVERMFRHWVNHQLAMVRYRIGHY